MTDDIPQWAIQRVLELHPTGWSPDLILKDCNRNGAYSGAVLAFARYIAEHEEAPADPFVECIKLILGGFEGERHAQEYADSLRAALAERGLQIVEAPHA